MSADHQARLVGELDGTTVTLATSGRTFRPALRLPSAIVDECKLHVTDDGLRVTAVDPPNVSMIDIRVPPRAFDEYDLEDELTIGVNLNRWMAVLETARLGAATDDAIHCRITDGSITTTVTRDYDDTTVEQTSETLTIDPDSIRKEPDLPDLDLAAVATASAQSLKAVTDQMNTVDDHASIFAEDTHMVWGASNDSATGEYAALARFTDALEEPVDDRQESLYSLAYLKSVSAALVGGKVDAVSVRWQENFPVKLGFERTDDDGGVLYDGEYMIAPRLTSEDDLPE